MLRWTGKDGEERTTYVVRQVGHSADTRGNCGVEEFLYSLHEEQFTTSLFADTGEPRLRLWWAETDLGSFFGVSWTPEYREALRLKALFSHPV